MVRPYRTALDQAYRSCLVVIMRSLHLLRAPGSSLRRSSCDPTWCQQGSEGCRKGELQ
jgi:hypothetical protein